MDNPNEPFKYLRGNLTNNMDLTEINNEKTDNLFRDINSLFKLPLDKVITTFHPRVSVTLNGFVTPLFSYLASREDKYPLFAAYTYELPKKWGMEKSKAPLSFYIEGEYMSIRVNNYQFILR